MIQEESWDGEEEEGIGKLSTCSKPDSNLGPKHMSLLEFEIWRLRPLGHRSRFLYVGCSETNIARQPLKIKIQGGDTYVEKLWIPIAFRVKKKSMVFLLGWMVNGNSMSRGKVFFLQILTNLKWVSLPKEFGKVVCNPNRKDACGKRYPLCSEKCRHSSTSRCNILR